MKVRGFQITTSCIKVEKVGEKCTVSYVDNIEEITVDTDLGNFIITREDILEAKNYKTILEAWQDVFGTTQLSHAHARLQAAEKKIRQLSADVKNWKGAYELLDMRRSSRFNYLRRK